MIRGAGNLVLSLMCPRNALRTFSSTGAAMFVVVVSHQPVGPFALLQTDLNYRHWRSVCWTTFHLIYTQSPYAHSYTYTRTRTQSLPMSRAYFHLLEAHTTYLFYGLSLSLLLFFCYNDSTRAAVCRKQQRKRSGAAKKWKRTNKTSQSHAINEYFIDLIYFFFADSQCTQTYRSAHESSIFIKLNSSSHSAPLYMYIRFSACVVAGCVLLFRFRLRWTSEEICEKSKYAQS